MVFFCNKRAYALRVRPLTDRDAEARTARLPRPLPTREELAAIDVLGYLRGLDQSVARISNSASLASVVPADVRSEVLSDPRFCEAATLLQQALCGTLIATSFGDLPPEARVHPDVQKRLWAAMDEIDTAVTGVGQTLGRLTAEEQAAIGRAMRDEPEIGARVLAALMAEAEQAGVSQERRDHLKKLGEHACFRLRQSTPGFIAEQTEKLAKARPLAPEEAERHLAAQLGEGTFLREKEWQLTVFENWKELLREQSARLSAEGDPDSLSPDDAYAPPTADAPPPANPFDPGRGKTVLKVGAWLFGIGLFAGLAGALLVSSRDDDTVIAGLFSFTAAAVLSVAGIICLLVGAILRAKARSEASYLEAASREIEP